MPADYITHFRAAAKQQPWEVKHLDQKFFKDYSSLKFVNSIRPGSKVGDPAVTDICALNYTPDCQIQFKLDFSDHWIDLPQ